jgi:hypothetical protein
MYLGGDTADAQFGPDPAAQQPTPTAAPTHLGGPEPMARTKRDVMDAKGLESPAVALVVLLGIAVVLLHLISK